MKINTGKHSTVWSPCWFSSQVFHGADSDIEWLQRDFGVYVVNLFDTHQASRVLNLARHSLDHLLKHFCNVGSDKRYQLADWRIRYGIMNKNIQSLIFKSALVLT